MLFYRNREHRFAAFHQEAPYLFDPTAPELAEYDSGRVKLECTKRAAAFGVWGVWSLFGPQMFADMVDVTIDLAQQFHATAAGGRRLRRRCTNRSATSWRFATVPERLRTSTTGDEVDAFQLRLRRAVIESGEFYLVQSRIDGRPVLRTTMMNPLTTVDDLAGAAGLPAAARRAACGSALLVRRPLDVLYVRPQLGLVHLLAKMANFVAGRRSVGFDCVP